MEAKTISVDDSQRTPLGQRTKKEIGRTVLRIAVRDSKAPALDVAAFNSFVD